MAPKSKLKKKGVHPKAKIIINATQCSPARYCHHRKTGTCLVSDEIVMVLRAHGVEPPQGATHAQLVALMRATARQMGVMQRTEQSLADLAGSQTSDVSLRRKIKDAYRPVAPRSWDNPKNSQWLSSDDIDTVMRQYESARSDFMFIGVTPIDFDERPTALGGRCVSPAMCALDVPGLVKGGTTTHLGVVLNMDKHDAGGSHWVSVYIGLDPRAPNYGVFYYDSVANPPHARVAAWMHGIAGMMKKCGLKGVKGKLGSVPFHVKQNKVRRQFGQSECGIFSMMFLIHCMHRVSSFKEICVMLGGDEVMKAMRNVLFRPSNLKPGESKAWSRSSA